MRSPHLTQTTRNDFGHEVPALRDILADDVVMRVARPMMEQVMAAVRVNRDQRGEIIPELIEIISRVSGLDEVEARGHELFVRHGLVNKIRDALATRAASIIGETIDSFRNDSLLDLGCGDGQVGKILSGLGMQVNLADIYKHDDIDATGLPFELLQEGGQLPFHDETFENVFLSAVLHHSNDPKRLLREAVRVAKPEGRVVLIESVYSMKLRDFPNDQKSDGGVHDYARLNANRQFMLNCFFDWLYNRIIHFNAEPACKINVPCNFLPPQNWQKNMQDLGLKVEPVRCLGFDQKIVPEVHTRHVGIKPKEGS